LTLRINIFVFLFAVAYFLHYCITVFLLLGWRLLTYLPT